MYFPGKKRGNFLLTLNLFLRRETPRFDRPQNSVLMTYFYRESLIGCCTGLNFRQQREPIRGPAVASRHWCKMFRLEFASHEAEGQEKSASLQYWPTDLLFCVEIASKILMVGEMKEPKPKGLALAKDKRNNIFRSLRSHEVGEK